MSENARPTRPALRRMQNAALAATAFLALTGPALADPPRDIDAEVRKLMADGGAPGLALGIVENGQTVLARGYGVRELGKPEPVDERTLFQIGSTTKAVTSAALALLVEEGKLGWDDKVIDHLPEFQMYDPYVTREFTIRDLLTHRSGLGLGAGDLTFLPRSDITRAEVVKAMRWLKPQTSFRSQFAYDNLLYAVAGVVIERESGRSWEDFVRERVLRPIGMSDSTTDEPSRYLVANRAQAHDRLGPPFRGVGPLTVLDEKKGLSPNVFPCGGIMSSATDMSRWIAVQLAHGRLADGKTHLWSEASAYEMWKPVTPIPAGPARGPLAGAAPQFRDYALGWFVQDYKGHKIIQHSGGTLGFLTQVVLIPEKNTGFVILQNSNDGSVYQALEYTLLDHYLGLPPTDWGAAFAKATESRVEAGKAELARAQKPTHLVPRTLSSDAVVGRYKDNWYGAMDVRSDHGALVMNMRRSMGMEAVLEPYNGDTFIARWTDKTIEPAYVAFVAGESGKVAHVTLKAVSPLADFSFDYQDLDFTPVREGQTHGA